MDGNDKWFNIDYSSANDKIRNVISKILLTLIMSISGIIISLTCVFLPAFTIQASINFEVQEQVNEIHVNGTVVIDNSDLNAIEIPDSCLHAWLYLNDTAYSVFKEHQPILKGLYRQDISIIVSTENALYQLLNQSLEFVIIVKLSFEFIFKIDLYDNQILGW